MVCNSSNLRLHLDQRCLNGAPWLIDMEVHKVTDLLDRLLSLLVSNTSVGFTRRCPMAPLAILPPHSANRHDAGCRGAGSDRMASDLSPRRKGTLDEMSKPNDFVKLAGR